MIKFIAQKIEKTGKLTEEDLENITGGVSLLMAGAVIAGASVGAFAGAIVSSMAFTGYAMSYDDQGSHKNSPLNARVFRALALGTTLFAPIVGAVGAGYTVKALVDACSWIIQGR